MKTILLTLAAYIVSSTLYATSLQFIMGLSTHDCITCLHAARQHLTMLDKSGVQPVILLEGVKKAGAKAFLNHNLGKNHGLNWKIDESLYDKLSSKCCKNTEERSFIAVVDTLSGKVQYGSSLKLADTRIALSKMPPVLSKGNIDSSSLAFTELSDFEVIDGELYLADFNTGTLLRINDNFVDTVFSFDDRTYFQHGILAGIDSNLVRDGFNVITKNHKQRSIYTIQNLATGVDTLYIFYQVLFTVEYDKKSDAYTSMQHWFVRAYSIIDRRWKDYYIQYDENYVLHLGEYIVEQQQLYAPIYCKMVDSSGNSGCFGKWERENKIFKPVSVLPIDIPELNAKHKNIFSYRNLTTFKENLVYWYKYNNTIRYADTTLRVPGLPDNPKLVLKKGKTLPLIVQHVFEHDGKLYCIYFRDKQLFIQAYHHTHNYWSSPALLSDYLQSRADFGFSFDSGKLYAAYLNDNGTLVFYALDLP